MLPPAIPPPHAPPRQGHYGPMFYGWPHCSAVFLNAGTTDRRDVASPPGSAREQAQFLQAAYRRRAGTE